jgi:hypothetical protein
MFEPENQDIPLFEREVPEFIGWSLLGGAIVYLGTQYNAGLPVPQFLGVLFSMICLGFLGLGGMRIKSYLLTVLATVPIVFGLSFLFVVARTQIPEEVRAEQVLADITAQELRLYDHLITVDTEPSAVAVYEEINADQNEIEILSDRADAIWASIPVGTVIMRNRVPVGEYREVVEIRDDVRLKQAQLDRRKRTFAMERSAAFDAPEIAQLVSEQEALFAEQSQLEEQIREFEATSSGQFRAFSQFVMIGLVVAGVLGFFWLIIAVQ